MNKIEFLEQLRTALSSDVSKQVIQENISYYNQYIDDEMRKGRTEQEVMDELGDPWLIARTIIDAVDGTDQEEVRYEENCQRYSDQGYTDYGSVHRKANVWTFDTWWKKLLLVLCIVGVVMLIFAIVGGIVSLVAPILIPVLIIVFLIRLLTERGRR